MSFSVPYVEVPLAYLGLHTVVVSTACFAVTVLAVGLWTHHHGPVRIAAWAMRRNNQIYAAVSVVMLGLIVQFSVGCYNNSECMAEAARSEEKVGMRSHSSAQLDYLEPTGIKVEQGKRTTLIALAPLMYHYSKFWEYLDIVLVLANHGPRYRSLSKQPIGLHFGFHHLTTPYLTWFRIIQSSSLGWEVFAGLNCIHHAIMYSFFSGGVKIIGLEPETLRKILPWTGGFQLVAGIAMEAKALTASLNNMVAENSSNNSRGHWVALSLLSTYLVLYMRDLRQRGEVKASATQKKLD